MPISRTIFKAEISNYIHLNFKEDAVILDVGPGIGTYFDLLKDKFKNIDCCEIFVPYIERFKLRQKYRQVFSGDICDFQFDYYDLIILGDVLEHIEKTKAVSLVQHLYSKCGQLIVVVPFLLKQGPSRGNIYESHLQPDLTKKVMADRYPLLRPLVLSCRTGVYIKQRKLFLNR